MVENGTIAGAIEAVRLQIGQRAMPSFIGSTSMPSNCTFGSPGIEEAMLFANELLTSFLYSTTIGCDEADVKAGPYTPRLVILLNSRVRVYLILRNNPLPSCITSIYVNGVA